MNKELIAGFRLSPQQERLWSLTTDHGTLPFRSQCAIRIEGRLEIPSLTSALEGLVNRHEILRTAFHLVPGIQSPLQVISGNKFSALKSYDLSAMEPSAQEAQVALLCRQARLQPLDLEHGPLMHSELIVLSPLSHILIVSLSALCADETSLGILVSELSALYLSCPRGEEVADAPMQYADISEWQNELMESEEILVAKEYWRKKSFATLFNVKLPFEKPVAGKAEFTPHILPSRIDAATLREIESLAAKYDTEMSAILLCCWQALLWRLGGETEIIVGMACGGRSYPELEAMPGLFTRYVPLHSRHEENSLFSELLSQVAAAANAVQEWQEGFTWEAVASSLSPAGSQFFPVCFDFVRTPAKHQAADVSFVIERQYSCIEKFKVKLSCVEENDGLVAEFHYDSTLFSPEDIERLAGQFQKLLESAVSSPETLVSELEIVNEVERQQVLFGFNQAPSGLSDDLCIHELFEAQAERTPEALAVVYENEKLSYSELNRRANGLAHHLRESGIVPDQLVGICLERSVEFVIAMLGILKAGAGYVPMDPALPVERLAFLMEDTGARVLLIQQPLTESLPGSVQQVICLGAGYESTFALESDENPAVKVASENIAYVIYTSGSTGLPKGVAVEHRQLVNYSRAISERLDIRAGFSFALVSTFAADLGNTVIFPSLCSGGTLHVISQEMASDPVALAGYMRQHPIDCLKIVPSHLAALMTSEHPEQILPRQRLVLGGEASNWEMIETIRLLSPGSAIFNHYGPTEATVGVLTYCVAAGEREPFSDTLPLGRPLKDIQVYLLDSLMRPLPVGVCGELYTGGAGLTRGYLNHPELTADKFVPNPFSEELGARLYRTGDRARYLPGGDIEFLGRIDRQTKIRGFRVELGEIETTLRQCPDVQDAIAKVYEYAPGDKRLVAYVIVNQGRAPASTELRRYLKERLPEYMIPAVFMLLQTLPLTTNGKVNYDALPSPSETTFDADATFVAPRTPVEEALAEVWADVLRISRVGVHDNFFALGGDSILSIQITARANRRGLRLTPRQLFQHQTIAELAPLAHSSPALLADQSIVSGPVPLTPVQSWFFEQGFPDPHHFNQSILLEAHRPLDPAALELALHHLLLHHDALRLRFIPSPDQSLWQQFNAASEPHHAFSLVDFSALPAEQHAAAIEAAANKLQQSLDLAQGPLMRVVLFDLGALKANRLLIIVHHLAVDGVSWRILLEDLQRAYRQALSGVAIDLGAKTTSFKQWAEQISEYARSSELRQERAYWQEAASQSSARLPLDDANGDRRISSAQTLTLWLSEEETRQLLQDVPAVYRTQINDVLLTALAQAFYGWTGERALVIEMEGHGREEVVRDADVSRTVGWFTSMYPVRLELEEGAESGGLALQSIKEQLRRVPQRGVGYGLLRYLSGDEEMREELRSEAEVSFNYLGQFDQVLGEEGEWGAGRESTGEVKSEAAMRGHVLEINGSVAGGRLQMSWTYSEGLHRRETVEGLGRRYMEALRGSIEHCRRPEAGGFSPSDFPEANLSQADLDELLAELEEV